MGASLGLLASLGLGLGLVGCGDDTGELGAAALVADEDAAQTDVGEFARVHLTLQPRPDVLEPEPQLQVRGRFVEYRGVSESVARSRTSLAPMPWDQLVVGQCVASESLLAASDAPGRPASEVGERELSLIDAGDLRIALGGRELVAPLGLVPDILPWFSGVEYLHVDDRIPALAPRPDGTAPVTVTVDGSREDGLSPFSVTAAIPEPLELQTAHLGGDRLTVEWKPAGSSTDMLVLELQAFSSLGEAHEPRGEAVTCLVTDSGRTNLALSPLVDAGLAPRAGLLRVSASRFDVHHVPAGRFGDVEVIVELRSQATLGLTR